MGWVVTPGLIRGRHPGFDPGPASEQNVMAQASFSPAARAHLLPACELGSNSDLNKCLLMKKAICVNNEVAY